MMDDTVDQADSDSVQESRDESAYASLGVARRHIGMGRLMMGLQLLRLQESGGWRGRTAAKSFRRFLVEEGIDPPAAYRYMTVVQAFIVDAGVEPQRIAGASFAVMSEASKYLVTPDLDPLSVGNVEDIVSIVTTLPSAEAYEALRERYEIRPDVAARAGTGKSKPVAGILGKVEQLTHDQRGELYAALHLPKPQGASTPAAETAASPAAQPARTPPKAPLDGTIPPWEDNPEHGLAAVAPTPAAESDAEPSAQTPAEASLPAAPAVEPPAAAERVPLYARIRPGRTRPGRHS